MTTHDGIYNRREFASVAGTAVASVAADPVFAATRRTIQEKGFCTVVRKDGGWLKRIQALNAKRYYSWGADIPENVPEGVDFVSKIQKAIACGLPLFLLETVADYRVREKLTPYGESITSNPYAPVQNQDD